MEAYQLRVVQEKEDLDVKIKALDTFLATTTHIVSDRYLLVDQLSAMKKYSQILGARIDLFRKGN